MRKKRGERIKGIGFEQGDRKEPENRGETGTRSKGFGFEEGVGGKPGDSGTWRDKEHGRKVSVLRKVLTSQNVAWVHVSGSDTTPVMKGSGVCGY